MSCQGFVLLILNLIYSWDNVWGFFQTCLVTRISSIWVAGRVGIYFLQTRPWYLDEPHFSQGNWSFSCLGSQEMDFGLWQQGLDWKQGMERMELMTVIRKCPLIPKKSGKCACTTGKLWVWLRYLRSKVEWILRKHFGGNNMDGWCRKWWAMDSESIVSVSLPPAFRVYVQKDWIIVTNRYLSNRVQSTTCTK